jgi:hypothetical protein
MNMLDGFDIVSWFGPDFAWQFLVILWLLNWIRQRVRK